MKEIQPQYDLVLRDQEYIIYCNDQPLLTQKGRHFAHTSDRLMKNLLTDLQSAPDSDPAGITQALLFGIYKDQLDDPGDFILDGFDTVAHTDPFICMKTGERKPGLNEARTLTVSAGITENSMDLAFWSFSSILKNLNTFIEENIGNAELLEDQDHPLILLLRQRYIALPPEKRSALQILLLCHNSGFVLPFLFVSGRLSVSEYAKGVLALHLSNPVADLHTTDQQRESLHPAIVKIRQQEPGQDGFSGFFADGAVVDDFLSFFSLPVSSEKQTRELIAAGESGKLEFKSTLRWDLKQEKTNQAIERASLKSICAFLNAIGGTLIIGVRDDGSIEGIESDKLLNDDRFLLHLWTLIRTCLGRDVSPYIQTRLEKINEKTICIVTCSPGLRPVFLRQPGFPEEFYIRLGPSSASLDISEALKYIADRFGNQAIGNRQ